MYYYPFTLSNFLYRNWVAENNLKSRRLTCIYMYRDLLISKEKRLCSGESYRQADHRRHVTSVKYQESVGDDLELFFEDENLGGMWHPSKPENWTYFVRELNPEELELVEKKDKSFFKKFKWSSNPDVDETEMQLSTSTSKYVSAYCNRRTYYI